MSVITCANKTEIWQQRASASRLSRHISRQNYQPSFVKNIAQGLIRKDFPMVYRPEERRTIRSREEINIYGTFISILDNRDKGEEKVTGMGKKACEVT